MEVRTRVLVVDDEPGIRRAVERALGAHDVTSASDVAGALDVLQRQVVDVLLTDVQMPGGGGLELVRRVASRLPDLSVIVLSGRGTLEDFTALLRLGVVDYVLKPFTAAQVQFAVARAEKLRELRAENARLLASGAGPARVDSFVGKSPPMRQVKEKLALAAADDTAVLLTGDSGTGKEIAARCLHELSPRAEEAFIAVNCGALPDTLLESALFGHVRGAFTGADADRPGCFERAHGGTLFLDEIGTMSPEAQVRLLRVLSTREVSRVGETRLRRFDARVVAATNLDLERAVAEGSFREDLYYRLNVLPIRMPTLAERGPEDILLLARHFLAERCRRMGRPLKELHPDAADRLGRHAWPGNVRELENAIERAIILGGDERVVEAEDLVLEPVELAGRRIVELPPEGLSLRECLARLESSLVDQALERTGGNKQRAAELLGMKRTALVQKLKRREQAAEEGAGR